MARHTIDRLQPAGALRRGHGSGFVGDRQRPSWVASRGELERPIVRTPEADPSSDERTQTLEQVIQPA
ncbi:MAG TPA: hypothetical protein VGR09_06540 [Gemmatimonadales bacterium]|nr:hypothetical protein [Gemmatimonadales bacterium]